MQIANIFPIANQAYYKQERVVMILAHLVSQGLYDFTNFSKDQYVIMDNGAYEKSMISNSLQDCIDIAESSGIKVDEIIVPDDFGNLDGTIQLFKDNYDTIVKYKDKYKFMFVAHNKNIDELAKAFEFIDQYSDLGNIVVGIPKCSGVSRNSNEAISLYKMYNFPIHFLGIVSTFDEIVNVKNIIRSCDTSQVSYMTKNLLILDQIDKDILPGNLFVQFMRDDTVGPDVDLANDVLSNKRLEKVLYWEKEAFKEYGIL